MRQKTGRPIQHGSYSLKTISQLVQGRPARRLREYLSRCRQGILLDLGGEDKISTGKLILLDRAINKLCLLRLIEIHTMREGVFKAGELAAPLRNNYLAFTRELRADLLALGIERQKAEERILTPAELAEIVDREAEEAEHGHHKGDS